MKIEITGAFSTYGKAQEAVRTLEFAGITGEEVEVRRHGRYIRASLF